MYAIRSYYAEGVQVKHFLPLDSIYSLSARAEASGKGIDFMSPKAVARFDFHLQELVYSRFHIADVALKGALKNTLLTANLTSNNELVKLTADAGYVITSYSIHYTKLYDYQLLPGDLQHKSRRTI